MKPGQIEHYLREQLASVPLESFLASVPVGDLSEEMQQTALPIEENKSTEGEILQDDEDDV